MAKTDIRIAPSIVLLATILLIVAIGKAEPEKAVLTGRVMDPSGLGIPGVKLTIIDSTTSVSRSTVSDTSGRYRLSDLPMGKYHITATYRGFAPYSQEVTLDDNAPRQLDVSLQILPPKESVTVGTQAPPRLCSTGQHSAYDRQQLSGAEPQYG